MSSRFLLKTITILVFAVVILVPLFYFKQGIYPFLFDKALFFQALVEVLFGLWLVFIIYNPEYRPRLAWIAPRKNLLLFGLAAFVAALVFTAFAGVDVWRSFFSTYERAYGVFGIAHMAALVLILSSIWKKIPWRWLFAASIATSVLIGAFATLEFYYNHNFLLEQPGGRAGATLGNPSFLAGYLTWHIFLVLYFLFGRRNAKETFGEEALFGWKKTLSVFLFSRAYLIFVALLGAAVLVFVNQSRGNILGFAVGIFTLFTLLIFRPPQGQQQVASGYDKPRSVISRVFLSRATYVVALALIVAAGSIFWLTRASDFWGKIPGIERFRSVSLEAEGLQPRLIALRAAWQGFLERPIFGWGPENFNIVFNKHYDPKALRANYQETRFDKPHNFMAEDIVTGGAVLTLAHLLFLGAFIFAAWRFGDKLFGRIAIAALAGYFVGNLFLFSTIGSDLPLFILVGFLAGTEIEGRRKMKEEGADSGNNRPVSQSAFAIALILSLAFSFFFNINTMRASNYLFHGFFDLAAGKYEKGVGGFRKTLSIWSPWRWNFARDFAAAMSDFYFYNPELAKKEDVLEAIKWMEYARDEHPLDAYNHYALVDMYNEVSDIDPKTFLPAAEREAKIALELSPDRQQVYFSLAKTKTLEGDYPAAIELAKHGLSLDDQVADGHFYYGLLLLAHGDTETGQAELKQAIRLGRKWKNFHEPLTIGNLLAEAGKINDAIELYAISVVMSHGENQLEPKTKLGVAFYIAGQKDKAKSELQYVADKFNFRTSPQFAGLKPILDELGVVY